MPKHSKFILRVMNAADNVVSALLDYEATIEQVMDALATWGGLEREMILIRVTRKLAVRDKNAARKLEQHLEKLINQA